MLVVNPPLYMIDVESSLHGSRHRMHCTLLHCTAKHCTEIHCTLLHCTALFCTALHFFKVPNPGEVAELLEFRPDRIGEKEEQGN